jgi:DNA recombination protein RmuC
MTEPLDITLIIGGLLLFAVFILLAIVLSKVNRLLIGNPEAAYLELTRLLQNNEVGLNKAFIESRKELREVSTENRREIQDVFKNLQDTLLKRISENSAIQIQQLNSFKAALNELSEKLINNSNDFKQSVSQSFHTTSEALNKKQDEFRDKTLQKLEAFDTAIKNDAKVNRDELSNGLKSFEGKFSESIKDFNEQLRIQFADLNKQQSDANVQAKNSILEIRQTIENQLKAIRDDNNLQLNEMRKTVDEKLHDTLEKRLGESFNLKTAVEYIPANKNQHKLDKEN